MGRAKRETSSFRLLPHHPSENRKLRTSGKIKGSSSKSVLLCTSLLPLFPLSTLSYTPGPLLICFHHLSVQTQGYREEGVGGLRGDPGLTPWYSDMFTSTQATYSGFASRNPASLVCFSQLLRSRPPPNDRLVVDLPLTGNRTKMGGGGGF